MANAGINYQIPRGDRISIDYVLKTIMVFRSVSKFLIESIY